ncbi:MAG: hypothetical protein ACI4LC_05940 [Emergencia sp.]
MKKSEELYQKIVELDALYQKRKPIRALKCFLVYVILFFIIFYARGSKGLGDAAAPAVVTAIIVFIVNSFVYVPFVEAAEREDEHLNSLKKEYEELIKRGL